MSFIKFVKIFTALVIIVPLCISMVPPGAAAGDDPDSKISSSLEMLIDGGDSQVPGAVDSTERQTAGSNDLKVFVYTGRAPDAAMLAEFAAKGVTAYPDSWIPPVAEHPMGYMLASVPAGRVRDLASATCVGWIDNAGMTSYPSNDLAATTVGTPTFWSGGFDGKGIRITVIDSGLDTTHPDIPAPVFSRDYSSYPALGDNITGSGDHGTHVTGSAVGRGTLSSGKYKGMAPGADLVFLKIEQEPPLSGATSAAMVGAIRAAVDTYKTDIITMSYGGWSDFHDGSDAQSQAVDYADSKGVPVFISAGNEANKGFHYSTTVPAGGESAYIKINIATSTGTDCSLVHNVVWYDGPGVEKNIYAKYYDATYTENVTQNADAKKSPRGTSQRYSYCGTTASIDKLPPGDSTYYMKLFNESDSPQLCHVYFLKNYGGPKVQFNSADRFYTVGSPGEADRAITIGSYTHRNQYINYLGTERNTRETLGLISSFSSRGPRVDTTSQVKPFIVSPGSRVISCRDRTYVPLDEDSISDNGINNGTGPADYEAWDGTSMATPIAAGCAALMMQSYPGLKGKPALVKQYLRQSSSKSSKPDFEWGYGLFSLQKVLQLLPKKATVSIPDGGGQLSYTTDLGTVSSLQLSSATSGKMTAAGYLPWGAYTCDISLLEPSGWANIDINMPSDAPDEFIAYSGGSWTELPLAADRGTELDLRLQDGGIADSESSPEGDIHLTGGPAVAGLPWTGSGPGSGGGTATAATPSQAIPVVSPSIVVQSAAISGTTARPGEQVGLTVRIANTSSVNGQAPLSIYVNGEAETRRAVGVGSGQSVQVEFSLRRDQPGTYYVQVNNVPAGTFTVEDPAARELPVLAVLVALLGGIVLVSILLWKRNRPAA